MRRHEKKGTDGKHQHDQHKNHNHSIVISYNHTMCQEAQFFPPVIGLSAGSIGFWPSFSTCALFTSSGSLGSRLTFSWLCCGSSDCAAPPWLGLLTGFCTDAVSGLPVRESVARLSLMVVAFSLTAAEGWAPVAFDGEVVELLLPPALEARRDWAVGYVVRIRWWLLTLFGVLLTEGAGSRCE